ncbi:MAG: DUF4190 domain-containing protein [Lachnospiraceae bacterium]|nr:DUF4190 domain-containing protein [Lachnospiraceae bacterium]
MEKENRHGLAFKSMIFGCVGLLTSFFWGGFLGIAGLVCGVIALLAKEKKKAQAIIGIITSVISILILIWIVNMLNLSIRTGLFGEMETIMEDGKVTEQEMNQLQADIEKALEAEELYK